jgi:hypothetical protein
VNEEKRITKNEITKKNEKIREEKQENNREKLEERN